MEADVRERRLRRLGISTMLMGLMMCVACHHVDVDEATSGAVKVRTVVVQREIHTTPNAYVGSVEEASASNLGFASTGRVTAVFVKDGQQVRKGQLLATLDSARAYSTYMAAQATLRQAEDACNRARRIYEAGGLSEVKWIEVQTQLNQAQSVADLAQQSLDDCRLIAPVDGTVADRNLEVGTSVAPYQTVMRLLNLGGLCVKVSIPEADMDRVQVGNRAQVRVNATGLSLGGRVDERNVSADPLSHSYIVRVRLDKTPSQLLPGMVCNVVIGESAGGGGMDVPLRAVQIDNDNRRFVWIVVDGKAHRSYVSIKDLSATGVIIDEGLADGDCVITDGALKVSEGTPVEL
ncbi:MAG: efflux RND transporter periplasmic adaptor subunit [Bacteroidales bacterium]|nr:efflux RND transporter periplasmic adaptor subunit [Bacteroidales bacterium]